MEPNYPPNQRGHSSNFRHQRGGDGHRNHRGGRGGGGGGGSKNQRKFQNKRGFHNRIATNTYHIMTDMRNNLPSSIDLNNQALIEYVGEIFFKESFLQDPWKKGNKEQEEQVEESGEKEEES